MQSFEWLGPRKRDEGDLFGNSEGEHKFTGSKKVCIAGRLLIKG